MNDVRWIEVFDDMNWAVEHFSKAVQIFNAGNFSGDDLDVYKSRMALMQSMQSGHTPLESGLERILDILGEEKPSGRHFHADLVRRVARDIPQNRPAIIGPDRARAVDETRRFRHVARKNDNFFVASEATKAIVAAHEVASNLIVAVTTFKQTIDAPS